MDRSPARLMAAWNGWTIASAGVSRRRVMLLVESDEADAGNQEDDDQNHGLSDGKGNH